MATRQEQLETIIEYIHPSLRETSYTYADIIHIAAIIGVNPQHLFGILTGSMYPHDIMIDRLKKYFPEEAVNSIISDFNPDARLDIVNKDDVNFSNMSVHSKYPAVQLEKNDLVKLDDGRWVKVSSVKSLKKNLIVYSNGAVAFSCTTNDFVVAVKDKGRPSNKEKTQSPIMDSAKREDIFNRIKEKYSQK